MANALFILTVSISLLLGFWLGYKIGRQITMDELAQLYMCSHGYDDSDKYPDCCH